jgi:hypothetical protein
MQGGIPLITKVLVGTIEPTLVFTHGWTIDNAFKKIIVRRELLMLFLVPTGLLTACRLYSIGLLGGLARTRLDCYSYRNYVATASTYAG